MANPKLHRTNGVGALFAETQPRQIVANSICPLPLIGWKPSRIAGPDGAPDQPTPILCMGAACAWFVMLNEEKGACAPAALNVITSGLPAALHHYFTRGDVPPGAPAPPAPTPDATTTPAAQDGAPPI